MFATPTSYCVTPGGRSSTPFSRLPSRASTILRLVLGVIVNTFLFLFKENHLIENIW